MRILLSILAVFMLADVSYGQRFLRHSSTYEEGVGRGVGSVIRSSGAANLNHARASSEYQRARRLAIDNHRHAVETYFYLRRFNREVA